jgi:microcystin-dependent protein
MRTLAFFTILISLVSLRAQSVPPLMNYQGHLTDEAGQPLPNGLYRVAFKVFEGQTSGTPLWQEEQNVSVVVGNFNAMLGSVTAGLGNAFNGSNRFLELTVVQDASGAIVNRALIPRQQLLSAPFAFQSASADIASSLVKKLADALCPPGTVIAWMGKDTDVPDGWALCTGQEVPRDDPKYAALFAVIGTSSGSSAASTFKIPDLRGVFLRGVSAASGNDPDVSGRLVPPGSTFGQNSAGTYQRDAFERHQHRPVDGAIAQSHWLALGNRVVATTFMGAITVDNAPSTGLAGDSQETRPKNVYVHYLIKL